MYTISIFLLVGCGGGGGSSNAPGDVTIPEELTPPEGDPKALSTRLADNPSTEESTVIVYEGFKLNVDIDSIEKQGEFRFLKVLDQNGKTLFLGQVTEMGKLTIPLHITAESFPLGVQVFSELLSDETTKMEVGYDSSFVQ